MFTFHKQKADGDRGEEAFFRHYADKIGISRLDGRRADFITPNSKETIELKSDMYDIDKTANFFMERWSVIPGSGENKDAEGKPGGPWQTTGKGIKFFVYYYYNSGVAYWFYADKLMKKLEKMEPKLKLRKIMNKGFDTGGYVVPRESLKRTWIFVDRLVGR